MFKTSVECAVELISSGGHDWMPVTAARVSFGKDGETGKDAFRDTKLMRYLAEHEHMSCFEHQTATFMIECPLFIRSQIMRHRTFSYNEISRRYTDENLEFWIPDKFRAQASSNRQASEGELDPTNFVEFAGWQKDEQGIPIPDGLVNGQDGFDMWKWSCYQGWHNYLQMLESGVCREQARGLLPQALLTRFYMTGNLRNWQHFLELRRGDGSQQEVAVIADRIADKLRSVWPNSCEVLGV